MQFQLQNLKVRDDLREVGLDMITKLKRIFQKGSAKMWTEFKYLKMGSICEIL
jgi:hypothetical protein